MKSMLSRQALACAFAMAGVASTAAAARLDTVPPTLKSFNVVAPADVAASLAQIVIESKSTDDLSGVQFVSFMLRSPHGQQIWIGPMYGYPEKSSTQRLSLDATPYLEPGTWTVAAADIQDAANNVTHLEQDALAALGKTQVTLVNSHPDLVDYTSPTFTAGTVVTPSVSASGTLKGTTAPQLFAADMTAKDAGSGVRQVDADWCLADQSACLYAGTWEQMRGLKKATVRIFGNVAGAAPGEYLLRYLRVDDHAGNTIYYLGSDFGGATDFSTLMPAGHTITVTP